jgi:hypothetical protein
MDSRRCRFGLRSDNGGLAVAWRRWRLRALFIGRPALQLAQCFLDDAHVALPDT